jgi:hypothetical protein
MAKYVVVTGRSSHTITAKNPSEAENKIRRLFPYARVDFIARVKRRHLK